MDGGELGWSNPGDYDPAFETTLNATKIGQVSQPVKSSFGWHIIEVLDRRNEDVSQEEQKNRARFFCSSWLTSSFLLSKTSIICQPKEDFTG